MKTKNCEEQNTTHGKRWDEVCKALQNWAQSGLFGISSQFVRFERLVFALGVKFTMAWTGRLLKTGRICSVQVFPIPACKPSCRYITASGRTQMRCKQNTLPTYLCTWEMIRSCDYALSREQEDVIGCLHYGTEYFTGDTP